MNFLKNYKGVALIYLILTLVNVIWIISYDKQSEVKQVSNERNFVLNAWCLLKLFKIIV